MSKAYAVLSDRVEYERRITEGAFQGQMTEKNATEAWLDHSRVIATFAVIVLHVSSGAVLVYKSGSQDWWIGVLFDSAVRWCVPVFVMISGALLLDANRIEGLGEFYRKRLSRILLPLLFWSFVYLVKAYIQTKNAGISMPAEWLMRMFLSGHPAYHMWFLFMLATMYLFVPFIRTVVRTSTQLELRVLVLIGFTLSILNGIAGDRGLNHSKLFFNWFLVYVPYFITGHIVIISGVARRKGLLVLAIAVCWAMTATGYSFAEEHIGYGKGMYFFDYLSITVVPMSICLMYLLKMCQAPIISNAKLRKISGLTLGVYLIHPIFLDLSANAGMGPLAFNQAVWIPCLSVAVFLMSLGTSWIISGIPYVRRVI